MATNYSVSADVIDLRTDTPRASDAFWIDTNVWYWLTYTRASLADNPPLYYQIQEYPRYISHARRTKAGLYRCELSLAELAFVLEKTEREIYRAAHGPITQKEFRHNLAAERLQVISEVNAAWGQIKVLAKPVHANVTEDTCDRALKRFDQERLDGYDAFIVEALVKAGISQIVTDDGDFATIKGLTVFTANNGVIQAAKAQNRIKTR